MIQSIDITDIIPLYYAMDFKGNVKSISKNQSTINQFINGPLKGNGQRGYVIASRMDWENEKINCSNIKNYKS